MGTLSKINVAAHVEARGILDLPPSHVASVNAPQSAFVRRADLLVGDYVKQGQTMVTLEHPDFIQLQQQYLESLAELDYLEKAYRRQSNLGGLSVNSEKEIQKTESEYKGMKAHVAGLENRLKFLGINPEKVQEDNISSLIYLRAPISGYITEINIHQGKYVEPGEPMYRLVDTKHMHLELEVYERDIAKINKGQQIQFTSPSHPGKLFKGEVHLIGRSFDADKKTVKIHGHIDEEDAGFMQGQYVEAKIMLGQTEVDALPEAALGLDDGQYFAFYQKPVGHGHSHAEGEEHHHGLPDEFEFGRLPVRTGASAGDLVEVSLMKPLPEKAKLVIDGAFFILAEMKKGSEAVHSH